MESAAALIQLDPLIVWTRVNWAQIFGNRNPIRVEVGFGNGSFLVAMAQRDPASNFLGIEIYSRGMRRALRRIERAGLNNVRLLRAEASAALPRLFGPEEVGEVYINFPDPWPKKRHWKRRLIKPSFVETLYRVLEGGGRVHLATDHFDYAQEMLASFEGQDGFLNLAGEKAFLTHPPEERLPTKYEQEFLREGKTIFYLVFQKVVLGGAGLAQISKL
ncbi:MAG: tRNA (guanosine(46)-N7)-methyltransferase TrmB [Nitrospinae bacterium]|nr:tRNA (guanosine(46)-N7)-methyltransferase TrmB [Nitrospinota bacterium]